MTSKMRALFLAIPAIAAMAVTARAASPTLDKIRASGTLTLGYREASVPFSYLDADHKPIGLSLDLCAKVAAAVKARLDLPALDVAYVAVNASNRIPLLQNGTIDIECGSTTNTPDRQKQVAFSVATFVSQPRWLVPAASSVTDASALKGKTVVITQGSLNLPLGEKINAGDGLGLAILQAKDHGESLLMLRTGRAAAWFEDDILLAGMVSASPDPKGFRVLPNTYGGLFYYGLMLPKDDAEFKALVDGVVKQEMASGAFTKAYDTWFTQPIPPKGQNLALPMSDALRARVAAPSDSVTP
jgi:glutamate/aspartate transport system substrate-binding protein